MLCINGREFELEDADEHTLKIMEEDLDIFPVANARKVRPAARRNCSPLLADHACECAERALCMCFTGRHLAAGSLMSGDPL